MSNELRACATSQGQGNATIKARRNMNMCERTRDQEGRQSHRQLDDGIRLLIDRIVQGKIGLFHIDQCRQTAGNRTGYDRQKKSAANRPC